ncbi:CAP-Gly domain containing linker protein BIK1 [Aspergillus candidus]|uniref:CAP-Gly domain-containing protein n=1 Tax=Aspergillus candidus TaxID=41067 RepID=A0A2I2F094_ASPCN|nr:hypothetical protein BDW47DRAFT_112879 [Aspergillus candidus]PLB34043.1 hypothetical protein BDW47DRAFT_112879 [Aspergillus candidus]
MAPLDEVQVGDLVNVPGSMYGTVRYLGTVAGKPGKFAGIELAAEHARRGKNSGDVDGKKYFATSIAGSGIFVPMNNNKYVCKRSSGSSSMGPSANPPTPSRPVNFSKSVGPGTSPAVRPPRVRRPSLPRPESPRGPPPSKLSLAGLRTPSAAARSAPSSNGYPRSPVKGSPVKAPSRASDRPPSRVSLEDDAVSTRTSDFPIRTSNVAEIQGLKDRVSNLEQQLSDRDQQLGEQAGALSEFQHLLEELEGSDALSVRAQLREKNDRIAQLMAEFDLHRADFRSTLDTLEIAASETERVYEQRLEEVMQHNRELQDRGEDVEEVARQLKQLEELVSELEEGLEDARRGEAEARAEVEFLRGEVERTKLELQRERENSAGPRSSTGGPRQSRELDQKDDEIRGLKAIIHSLSRGDPDIHALQQNGLKSQGDHDPQHLADLEQQVQELERLTEQKTYRIEELERELQQSQTNGNSRTRSSTVTVAAPHHQKTGSTSKASNHLTSNHSHRLSDRTVVPSDWHDAPEPDDDYQPYPPQRTAPDASHRRLETMPESDSRSDDGNSMWCEICETGNHDILSCSNMFGAQNKNKDAPSKGPSQYETATEDKPTSESSAAGDATPSSQSESTTPQKTGRDVVAEGLKGVGMAMSSSMSTTSMAPVAGKASGVIDETKWCALCERDGHESIDCPFDD